MVLTTVLTETLVSTPVVVGYQNTASGEDGTIAYGANNMRLQTQHWLWVITISQPAVHRLQWASSGASGEASVAIGNVAQATQIRATAVGQPCNCYSRLCKCIR